MFSVNFQVVPVSLSLCLSHLLQQGEVQTFHQVSVLHVTTQELGLLDQLTTFLCCRLIAANTRSTGQLAAFSTSANIHMTRVSWSYTHQC